jgi:phosphatidylserine/phosphatidylglycerophosphate/cardiolipin synthase-like enzyme
MKIEKIANGTEYASIGLSFFGTIAAITTQKIAYVAAPLTLSVLLSLLNRNRELTKATNQITYLEQQLTSDTRSIVDRVNTIQNLVVDLPLVPTPIDLKSLYESVEDIQQDFLHQISVYLEQNPHNFTQEIADYFPKYQYELVLGREQSRQALLDALASVENRLILICPWLCHHGFDAEIYEKLENLLIKKVTIEIGYGKLTDIEKGNLKGFFYDRLKHATSLADKYPNFKLKLIGTHEKYLVCDRSFAMLGSHNFLTSGISEEREIGIRTTDLNLIEILIERYEQAPDLESSYALN